MRGLQVYGSGFVGGSGLGILFMGSRDHYAIVCL